MKYSSPWSEDVGLRGSRQIYLLGPEVTLQMMYYEGREEGPYSCGYCDVMPLENSPP